MGFPHVESGPMVRSSYHADGQRDIVLALRNRAPMIPFFGSKPLFEPSSDIRSTGSACWSRWA